MYKYILKCFFICASILILFACRDKNEEINTNIFEIHQKTAKEILHFAGTVQPIHENTITSSFDGVLDKIYYQFGQRVKKGDIIFTLNSTSLQKQYNDALTEYLKAKDNYSIAKTKFIGTESLWKEGLIAKNNYISEKSNLNAMRVSLTQSLSNLSDLIEKIDGVNSDYLTKLNLSQFEKVQEILNKQHNFVQFRAPIDGVLLYPPVSADFKNNKLLVGSAIKAGQVLATIGDLQGIRIEIDISEIDINKITKDLPAIIKGAAFNQQELHGKVINITSQALISTSSGNLPSFQALVEVNNLTPEQQLWIKVGMSATVEISISKKEQLMIPISAVKLIKDKSVVCLSTKDGKIKQQAVTTGNATADEVAILKGLKEGDKILLNCGV